MGSIPSSDTERPRRWSIKPRTGAERRVIAIGVVLAFGVLLLDQLTKLAVERNFSLHESREVIAGFFDLRYVVNKGAAWSMFSGQTVLLLTVGIAVFAVIAFKMRRLSSGFIERYLALFAVLGGVIGNSIDRLFRTGVVDFLDFHIRIDHWDFIYHYPTFNVADIAICCGVGVFVLSVLFRSEKPAEPGRSRSALNR